MKLFFFNLLVAVVYSQTTFDPSFLASIFDEPITPALGSEAAETAALDQNTLSTVFGNPRPPAVTTAEQKEFFDDVFENPDPSAPSNEKRFGDNLGTPTSAPASGIEQNVLLMIFNTTHLTPVPDTPVKVVQNSAESNIHFAGDKTCSYCVPYYLCDSNKIDTNINDVNDYGLGLVDIRISDDDDKPCNQSVFTCCEQPAKNTTQLFPVKAMKCGYRNSKGLGYTFLNAKTQFGEFPWVVAVLGAKSFSYLGVGVLISPNVVMTAAHIASSASEGVRIRAGEWDTKTTQELFPFQEREVKEIYIHEDYDKMSHRSNNIALLRWDEPLELSEYINTICMPEQDEVFDTSKKCIANGWGKDKFGQEEPFAVILKKVELNMVPYSRCSMLLRNTKLGSRFKLHNSFLCAGGKEGEDTCEGDGGAPLACPIGNEDVTTNERRRYKLTGLVAWGVGCGQKDVPGAYTNVPMYRDWVDKKMANWGLSTASYQL